MMRVSGGAPDLRTLTAYALVPAILVITDVAADRAALKFLLLPPLGALTYLVFVNPARMEMSFPQVVACPCTVALYAWMLANTLGYNAISVALATIGTIAIMWAFRALRIVPPLALALLTILLHDDVKGRWDYPISVTIFTIAMYCIYQLWLRLPLGHEQEEAGT